MAWCFASTTEERFQALILGKWADFNRTDPAVKTALAQERFGRNKRCIEGLFIVADFDAR
ncbi:hypothetical protein V5E97_24605 [Singulisphaera sp. Ch08]|uniref:Uncharacterized protein n=1 Tax=Singulisphaera sp. Ch08 TaxID=3120278 RepID=A0AAU7C924_9BACT